MEIFSSTLAIGTAIHWGAVLLYIAATICNATGIIFRREKAERISYLLVGAGLLVHSVALGYRWRIAGHGPYMTRYEVLSSDAWVMVALFLAFARVYPRIRRASLIVFPSSFLLIALGLFLDPGVKKLPPTLRSIWLILHIGFYKIAVATILIAVALSVFLLLKRKGKGPSWLAALPEPAVLDVHAYRFCGFGFVFWGIGMVAGSIWAYQSWGRFWGWDPIETWSLISWGAFGIYLHLRRFFGWEGVRAAWFLIVCFVIMIIAAFFTSFMELSVHSEYFR